MGARDSLLQLALRLQEERLLRQPPLQPFQQQQLQQQLQLASQASVREGLIGIVGVVNDDGGNGAEGVGSALPLLDQLQMYSQLSRWVCGYVDRSEDVRFEATPVVGGATQQQVRRT